MSDSTWWAVLVDRECEHGDCRWYEDHHGGPKRFGKDHARAMADTLNRGGMSGVCEARPYPATHMPGAKRVPPIITERNRFCINCGERPVEPGVGAMCAQCNAKRCALGFVAEDYADAARRLDERDERSSDKGRLPPMTKETR
jgi:hypothetical protein